MIKNRLLALEKKTAGHVSHDDYVQAVDRVVAHERAHIDYLLHNCAGDEPKDAHPGDRELITRYEIKLTHGRDVYLPDGLYARINQIYGSLSDDELRKLAEPFKPNNGWCQTYD